MLELGHLCANVYGDSAQVTADTYDSDQLPTFNAITDALRYLKHPHGTER